MTTTSRNLLDRLRRSKPGQDDWLRFDDIDRPLIRRWVARVPGLAGEADDLTPRMLLVRVRAGVTPPILPGESTVRSHVSQGV